MPCRHLYTRTWTLNVPQTTIKSPEWYKECFKSEVVSQWKWQLLLSICSYEKSFLVKSFSAKDLELHHTLFFFSSKPSLIKSSQQNAKCGLHTKSFVFLTLFPLHMWFYFKSIFSLCGNMRTLETFWFVFWLPLMRGITFQWCHGVQRREILMRFFLSSELTKQLRWCKYRYKKAGEEISEEKLTANIPWLPKALLL